jgi:hypothetical protein
MNMIQVLKHIANTSVNTFSPAIMSIRPLFEEICIGKAKSRTYRAPQQERVKHLKRQPPKAKADPPLSIL